MTGSLTDPPNMKPKKLYFKAIYLVSTIKELL